MSEIAYVVRTRRFKLISDPTLTEKADHALYVLKTWANYGLAYLYKYYGAKRLKRHFPKTSMERRYAILAMKAYAKRCYLTNPQHCDADLRLNIQTVDKCYEQLLTNFAQYRHLQRVARHWPLARKQQFLKESGASLSGFGRIHFYGSPQKAVTLESVGIKDNGGRIFMTSSHTAHLPLFGLVHTRQSLADLNSSTVQEATIKRRSNGDLELYLTFRISVAKATPPAHKQVTALDLNQHDYIFANDQHGKTYQLPDITITRYKSIKHRITKIDQQLKTIPDKHSLMHQRLLSTRRKKYAHACNLLNAYYLDFGRYFCQKVDVLCLENLAVSSMRQQHKTRQRNRLAQRNQNKSLSILKFSWFIKMLTDRMQLLGKETRLVLPDYTSKVSHISGYLNQALTLGEENWYDPKAHTWLDRDTNAALNIQNWAFHPEQHMAVKLGKRTIDEVLTII